MFCNFVQKVLAKNTSEYNQITAGMNEQGTYRIMGCYKYIPDDIARFGVETMNEAIDDAPVDSSNYADYFGKYCIDVELGKMDLFNLNMEMSIAILTGIFMLLCLVEGLWNMNCVTKHLAKDGIDMERLDREMNSSDSVLFEEIGTYLTENYIVYFKEEIRAFRYTDIVWAFMNQTEGGDAQGLSAAGRAGGMAGGAVGGLIGGLIGGAIGAAMGTSNPYGITIYLRNGMAWNISMGKSKQTTADEITRALAIMKEKIPI